MKKQSSFLKQLFGSYFNLCFSIVIFISLTSTTKTIFENNWSRFNWEIVAMIFIVGALILSIRSNEKQNKIFLRIGSMAILSGILMLFSNGMQQFKSDNQLLIKIIGYPSAIVELLSVFLFSLSLAILFTELSKNLIDKD